MQIKLVRTENSLIGHILFYAWSNHPENDFYIHENQPITKIKLDYNREDALNIISPYEQCHDKSTLILNPEFEDDINVSHTVTLQSNDISFSQFCLQLIASGYNSNIGYNLLSNNCVDATRYALALANLHINLDLPLYKRLTGSFWRDVVTSYDLIMSAKEHINAFDYWEKEIESNGLQINLK